MNDKQKKFAELYAANPNATEAAKGAGYSEHTAYSQGQRLLKNVEVQNHIKDLQNMLASERIASIDEVKAIWTEFLRCPNEKTANRIKAGEMLAKSAGVFVPSSRKTEGTKNGTENSSKDDDYADVIFYDDRSEISETYGDENEVIIWLPRKKTEEECSLPPENSDTD